MPQYYFNSTDLFLRSVPPPPQTRMPFSPVPPFLPCLVPFPVRAFFTFPHEFFHSSTRSTPKDRTNLSVPSPMARSFPNAGSKISLQTTQLYFLTPIRDPEYFHSSLLPAGFLSSLSFLPHPPPTQNRSKSNQTVSKLIRIVWPSHFYRVTFYFLFLCGPPVTIFFPLSMFKRIHPRSD